MRTKKYLCLALLPVVMGVSALLWWKHIGTNQAATPKNEGDEVSKKLPLTQVVLFNSGVGYFHREGVVEGNARIDMSFAASDVNDLLKSLLLQDLSGGKISTVSYDSEEPIEVTLKAFALDLTANPSFGQLLNQARGEKVEVTTQQGNAQPGTMTGIIVGMESQFDGPNKETHLLNVLCTEGLRNVPLSQVQRVRFLNAALDAEFRKALDVLALSHDNQKKVVSLNFTGEGKRDVRVGYAIEHPMWKTSYRLVIDKDGKLNLQGWAIVENTTDEDWKDVRLTLVAARPISFKMDLYPPLNVPRPTVEPERFATLRPPTYNGALLSQGGPQPGPAGVNAGFAGLQQGFNAGFAGLQAGFLGGFQQGFQGLQAGFQQGFNTGSPGYAQGFNRYQMDTSWLQSSGKGAPRLSYEELQKRREALHEARAKALEAGSTLTALDSKEIDALMNRNEGEVEDSYQYVISEKVTIPRQKSALLPIFNQEITGTRLSIFNETVQNKNPLLGLRFKNTTDQPLMQGPVMVHDVGRYGGDARVSDMHVNEQRLLAYAIDQGMEVLAVDEPVKHTVVAMAIRKGFMVTQEHRETTKKYHIKNRSRQDRTLVIEHPMRSTKAKIISKEQPYETARDVHRFEVKVAAGKTAVLEVVEREKEEDSWGLQSISQLHVDSYRALELTPLKIKEALAKTLEKRLDLVTLENDLQTTEGQLKAVVEDQARLRANIERVPRDSAVYKRYLDKFDTQETQLEKLQAAVLEKREALWKRKLQFEKYLEELTVE